MPAGWWHWVANEQANMKLVLDGYRDSHFRAYMQSWKLVLARWGDSELHSDYSDIFNAAMARLGTVQPLCKLALQLEEEELARSATAAS